MTAGDCWLAYCSYKINSLHLAFYSMHSILPLKSFFFSPSLAKVFKNNFIPAEINFFVCDFCLLNLMLSVSRRAAMNPSWRWPHGFFQSQKASICLNANIFSFLFWTHHLTGSCLTSRVCTVCFEIWEVWVSEPMPYNILVDLLLNISKSNKNLYTLV